MRPIVFRRLPAADSELTRGVVASAVGQSSCPCSADAGVDWAQLRQQEAPGFAPPAPGIPQEDDFDWEWTSLVAALPVHYHYDHGSANPSFQPGSTGGKGGTGNTAATLLNKGASSPGILGSGPATIAVDVKLAPASPAMPAIGTGPVPSSPRQETAVPAQPQGHHHHHQIPSMAANQPHASSAQWLMGQLQHALHSPKSPRRLQSHAAG